MKSILVISFSDIAGDPRVMRQINALSECYAVKIIGYGKSPQGLNTMISLDRPQQVTGSRVWKAFGLLARCFEAEYWGQSQVRQAEKLWQGNPRPDCVVANDIDAVPLALKLADGAPVLFDAHEYAPREFEDSLTWRLVMGPYKKYLCSRYIPRVSAMITVGAGIAGAYKEQFGISAAVVYNAPTFSELAPYPVGEKIRLIHHGGVNRSRRLEGLLEMMPLLDQRFELDLMLMPNTSRYFLMLQKLVEETERVRLIPPVPMPQIPAFLNSYDIGVYSLPPTNFNNSNALPNKFFEFVQGRLAIAVGPTPEMAGLTRQYDLGIVADDFTPASMAAALNRLSSDDVARYKQHVHRAAQALCYEHSKETLFEVVETAIGQKRRD